MRWFLPCLVAIGACSDDTASPDTTSPTTSTTTPDTTGVTDVEDDVTPDTVEEIDGIPTIDDTEDEVTGLDVVIDDALPPAPPLIYLTIAEMPPEMNGSIASGELAWTLRANRAHVSLDVMSLERSGPITSASITCSADLAAHDLPTVVEVAPGHWRALIDADAAFPDGARVTCTADALGPGGSADASFAFDAATLPPALDPFPTPDEWLVVLSRDIFELDVTHDSDGTAVLRSDYVTGGDGVPDFDEPFYELGLFSRQNPEAAAIVKAHILEKVRGYLYGIYGVDADGQPLPGGVPIRLWFEGDEGAPDPADYGGARRFSMIALGGDGDLDDQIGGTFGRALIDYNNQDIEDDTVYGLGVFPTALARQVLSLPLGALVLQEYRTATGGTPFGDEPGDVLFLGKDLTALDMPDGSFAAQRIDIYNLFVEFGALGLASILAHEIGHSLGLVPEGLPPEGLFAGVETDFIVSLAPDAHVDTEGLNIMQTGGSVNWLEAVSGARPRFEPPSWAYLTRQLVVGELP